MKHLTLVRHAHAASNMPSISDFDRPLTRRGEVEAEALARRLATQGSAPDLLVTSTAQRARRTAALLAKGLKLPSDRIRTEERLYLARASEILDVVRSLERSAGHGMIVGHNPGLSELARLLAPGLGRAELSTATAYGMSLEVNEWDQITPDTLTFQQEAEDQ